MGEYRTTNGEQLPLTSSEKRVRIRTVLLLFLLLFLLLVLLGAFIKVPRYALASGYVTMEEYAEVRPPVNGIVSNILIKSGAQVEKGQIMLELNSQEEEALLAETRARVSKLKTEIERRKAEMSIDLERRDVDLKERKFEYSNKLKIAELELENAKTKLELTREMISKGLKAANNLLDDELKVQLARVNLDTLKSKDFKIYEELLLRDKSKYDREIAALGNELSALEDATRRVQARLEMKKIRAPIAGQVVRYEFVVGELIQPTNVLYEIFGGTRQVLKLRVPERQATRLASGQAYRAELTSVNGLLNIYFRGKVEHVRNVIQNEGASTYRVAYCSFDQGKYIIPPGTTAEARIYYGQSNLWYYLFNIDP